ncbi:hypothetical protein [Pedobacter panaciterrae]|jgi:hypothetical protein|uniref:Uncharacterized protein n=1 Tax=Pedobacter panaciterrae TaxID=363849 RepID=A0ABU8NT17_9SPHI|nr:hypothetical protein [Pedobacter panaciterrae]NQX54637.1 hypothetical protein [Pedobacter panaciterrae]
MKPLKIYFKILQTGNGKYLKTKNEVSNLIVDIIDRNPTKSSSAIREIAIEDFKNNDKAQKTLCTSARFFIQSISDIEVAITFLPQEKLAQEQFYTQWRYVQKSEPYRLVQYLDENRLVVYSDKTKVLHTVKLDKDVSVIVEEE